MKIHKAFTPDRLRKDPDNPLPRQANEPSDPVVVHGKEEYEVQEVLASRILRGKLQYRIK